MVSGSIHCIEKETNGTPLHYIKKRAEIVKLCFSRGGRQSLFAAIES
jgi:hypothetical protein